VGRDARRPPVVERPAWLVGNVGQAGGLIAALVSLTAAVAGSAAAVDFTLMTIPHGGLTRTALVHVPLGAGDPRPVVLKPAWRRRQRRESSQMDAHGRRRRSPRLRRCLSNGTARRRAGFSCGMRAPAAAARRPRAWTTWASCCGRSMRSTERVAIDRTRFYPPTRRTASPPSRRRAARWRVARFAPSRAMPGDATFHCRATPAPSTAAASGRPCRHQHARRRTWPWRIW